MTKIASRGGGSCLKAMSKIGKGLRFFYFFQSIKSNFLFLPFPFLFDPLWRKLSVHTTSGNGHIGSWLLWGQSGISMIFWQANINHTTYDYCNRRNFRTVVKIRAQAFLNFRTLLFFVPQRRCHIHGYACMVSCATKFCKFTQKYETNKTKSRTKISVITANTECKLEDSPAVDRWAWSLDMLLSAVHCNADYYPGQKKKEPSPRFAARRTLFDLEISCSMTHDQRRAKSSATVRDFCPALIVRHRAWYHTMEQRSSCH